MKEVVWFTSRRAEGNARTPAVLKTILKSRRAPRVIATAEQVHGARVAVVPRLRRPKRFSGVDGLLTVERDLTLGIYTADCAPIFLSVPAQGVIGVLHAGWRGVQANILGKALRLAQRRWGCSPKGVHLRIGPHIGPCCFEVKWDVARFFPKERRPQGKRWKVDLAAAIAKQARRAGVPAAQIHAGGACTFHQRSSFSYRRDQTKERQISIGFQRNR